MMKRSVAYDAVLFSMEEGAYPYKYRLYFAVAGEAGQKPVLHRLFVNTRREFRRYILGGIYNLEYSGIRITNTQLTGNYPMTDVEYFELIRQRDIRFMDKNEQRHLNVRSKSYDPSKNYYSFSVMKSLAEYEPGFFKKLIINGGKLICYLLSFFIPVGMYLLFIYFCAVTRLGSGFSAKLALTVPITALGLVPFVIWMMSAINCFGVLLMLNIDYTRSYLLKGYALRWGGVRKSCYIEDDQRRYLFKSGIITLGIAVLCVIVSLIIR